MSGPRTTVYRVARSPADFRHCHELMVHTGHQAPIRLHKPTVIARREDKLLGFVSSLFYRRKWLVLGHIELAQGRHAPWTSLRLMEAYERVLRSVGIDGYYVLARADRPFIQELVGRGVLVPHGAPDHDAPLAIHWYYRVLGG